MSHSVQPAVMITGSSRGIGLSAAIELARSGFAVALNGPADDAELKQAAIRVAEVGGPVVSVVGDVGDLACHADLLEQAEASIGPLSTLINNAGTSVAARTDPLEVTEASYDHCQNINAKAQFFLSQRWAKQLLQRQREDGRFYSLINVSSCNAVAVSESRAEYCVSKAASAMVTKAFALRLGRENIAVYDIQPGVIKTAMTEPVIELYQQRVENDEMTLLPRLGLPEEVARCMVTLATGGLPYTTGQVISVDAGLMLPRF